LTLVRTIQNHLLARLPPVGLDRLLPQLEQVSLPVRKILEIPGARITHVYFPLSGVCTVVASAGDDRIEVGLIGRDGMTGVSVVLGAESSPHECVVQIAGEALRITVSDFNLALESEPELRKPFLLYARCFMLQTAQTALANGRLMIEKRLVRWLLMSQDRLDGDDVPLTHEVLSHMLGVRRPGVTIAVQALEAAGLVRNTRGCITILNRAALEAIAGEAYARL
jgi:CRP-like cAMP-binding protein